MGGNRAFLRSLGRGNRDPKARKRKNNVSYPFRKKSLTAEKKKRTGYKRSLKGRRGQQKGKLRSKDSLEFKYGEPLILWVLGVLLVKKENEGAWEVIGYQVDNEILRAVSENAKSKKNGLGGG